MRNQVGAVPLALVGLGLLQLAAVGWAEQGEAAARSTAEAPVAPLSCWHLGDVPGPEDLVIDRSRHGPRLLISSQDRRSEPRPPGGLYAIALDAGSTTGPKLLSLEGRDDCSFHPHGISLVQRGEGGPWLLYVINHHETADTSPARSCLPGGERLARHGTGFTSIEVYRVERRRLRFLQRLADPKVLRNGNDLVALDNGDVFVTSPPVGLMEMLRDLAADETASEIVRFECQTPDPENERCLGSFERVATLGRYVNGVEARKAEDGSYRVYVASSLEAVLYELRLDADGEIVMKGAVGGGDSGVGADPPGPLILPISVPEGLDNLSWETGEQRALLAAAHPSMRNFLQHGRSPDVPSRSQVWRIPVLSASPDRPVDERPLLQDEGSLISAASTAVCHEGDLVLGQVFESAVLRCEDRCRKETEVTP